MHFPFARSTKANRAMGPIEVQGGGPLRQVRDLTRVGDPAVCQPRLVELCASASAQASYAVLLSRAHPTLSPQ